MLSYNNHYQLEKKNNTISVSFEFFPPKNEILTNELITNINKLQLLNPSFISITCGSNPKIKNNTYKLVKKIKKNNHIHVVPHLTCINYNSIELKKIAKKYWKKGIKSILALRGDKTNNSNTNEVYAINLINILKKVEDFNIYVAAYPEVHPEAKNAKLDLLHLKNKFSAGANSAITQFFFNADYYLRFRDKCSKFGIYNDLIPGILPIIDLNQLKKFTSMTNVTVPKKILELLNNLKPHSMQFNVVSSYITNSLVHVLYKEGVRKFHFYTLNKLHLSYAIAHILKIKYCLN